MQYKFLTVVAQAMTDIYCYCVEIPKFVPGSGALILGTICIFISPLKVTAKTLQGFRQESHKAK